MLRQLIGNSIKCVWQSQKDSFKKKTSSHPNFTRYLGKGSSIKDLFVDVGDKFPENGVTLFQDKLVPGFVI